MALDFDPNRTFFMGKYSLGARRFLFPFHAHRAANWTTARAPTHLTYSPLTALRGGEWTISQVSRARAVGELAAVCVKREQETSCTKTRASTNKYISICRKKRAKGLREGSRKAGNL